MHSTGPTTGPTATDGTPTGLAALARAALLALRYPLTGVVFGTVLVKSEVVSWYRIQEMFRFQSFHMYGVIGSAVVVGGSLTWLLRRLGARTLQGERLAHVDKGPVRPNHVLGGVLFGVGWAATGACPGPILALVGAGLPAYALVLLAAVAGTLAYGALERRLPH